MKKLASLAVAVSSLLLAVAAHAQTPAAFGDSGTLVLHAATGDPMLSGDAIFGGGAIGATPTLGVQTQRFSDPERCVPQGCSKTTTSLTTLYVAPRIHYFVIDNLSIGAEVLIASYSGSRTTVANNVEQKVDIDNTPTAFGIMPLIGYNVRLGDKFSLWPTGGIGFRRVSWNDRNTVNDPNDDVDFGRSWWFFNVDVPFLFHPTTNFAFGAGPGITATLSQSVSRKERGIEISESGYGTTDIRWLTAHLLGWF